MPLLPLPALICDVGGTNLRFALVTKEADEPVLLGCCLTADFPTMTEAAAHILAQHPATRPRSATFAIAGPVTGTCVTITNADFTIDLKEVCERFALEAALFLNDFEAQAIALPMLGGADLATLHHGEPNPDGARAVIGPGTGLGAGLLINTQSGFVPVPGEAGHITFGPQTAEDFKIWPYLDHRDGCVSPECVLSGSGLFNLYRAHCGAEGRALDLTDEKDVTNAALKGDALAQKAIMTFLKLLGRSAGDLALIPWASGGVYLTGGMITVLRPYLAQSPLVAALSLKPPHQKEMQAFPVHVIIRDHTALLGMTVLLREMLPVSLVKQDRLYRQP